jgi:hypothetical protein
MCQKSKQTKGKAHHTSLRRPPQVRCAQVNEARRSLYKKGNQRKSTRVKRPTRKASRHPGGLTSPPSPRPPFPIQSTYPSLRHTLTLHLPRLPKSSRLPRKCTNRFSLFPSHASVLADTTRGLRQFDKTCALDILCWVPPSPSHSQQRSESLADPFEVYCRAPVARPDLGRYACDGIPCPV